MPRNDQKIRCASHPWKSGKRSRKFERLEDRYLLAADVFDVISPSLQSSYNQFISKLSGAGSSILGDKLTDVLSTSSQAGFVSPALAPSQQLQSAHHAVYADWVSDASSITASESEDTYWDRVVFQSKETFGPILNKPGFWITSGVTIGCAVAAGTAQFEFAPVCGAALLSLGGYEVEAMINRGHLTIDHLRSIGASEDTIVPLEQTFNLISLGKQLNDIEDTAHNNHTLLENNAKIVEKLVAIGGMADDAVELLERVRPILQDGFRDKTTPGQEAFISVALKNVVTSHVLHNVGMASWLANQDTPLSNVDKELLRSLQLDDPDILAFAEIPSNVANDLLSLLGTNSTVFASLSDGGLLSVRGSAGSDQIVIRRDLGSHQIRVEANGSAIGAFPESNVIEIHVYAEEGDDFVSLTDGITIPSYVVGGPGNDRLQGGDGPDVLIGGAGNNQLFAGLGDDVSIGGTGDDEIVSGNGLDVSYGGGGNDQISDRDIDPQSPRSLADLVDYQELKTTSTKAIQGSTLKLDYTIKGAPVSPTRVIFYRDNGNRIWDASDTVIDTDNTLLTGTAHGFVNGVPLNQSIYFARAEFPDHSLSDAVTTFVVGVANDSIPPAVDIIDVAPDPRSLPVASIDVRFSESVAGVDVTDFTLTRNGVNIPLPGVAELSTSNNRTYSLTHITELTDGDGSYSLSLNAAGSGIVDAAGNALRFGAVENWLKRPPSSNGPGINMVVEVSPDPRNAPVDSVVVIFDESISLNSFTYQDIVLIRNGNQVALNDTVTVSAESANQLTIRVSGLTSFTSAPGAYELRVFGAGITDFDGNGGHGEASDTWINGTPPKATLTGTLWADADADSQIDSAEARLAGWTVFLDADNDGLLDAGERTAITDASGNYLFGNLDPGTYIVREVVERGWEQTSPPGSGVLYFSEGLNTNGLYRLSTTTGSATLLGKSGGLQSDVGLSATANEGVLLGSSPFDLVLIKTDGSGTTLIDGSPTTTGLDYDYEEGTWYGAQTLQFFTLNPVTWQIDQQLPTPPIMISGLAYGDGRIYALGGSDQLAVYDIAASTWSLFPQNVNFHNSDADYGLAYDNFQHVLYGKADGDPNLYRINPVSGASSVIGNTGIVHGGGLAFVGHRPVPRTVTVNFGDVIAGLHFGHKLAADSVPPAVSLISPSVSSETSPIVTVSAVDNMVIPDGATAFVDVDLNADGQFDDPGELGYSTSIISQGSASVIISPSLSEGRYNLRARASDLSGNEGVSQIRSLVIDTTPPIIELYSALVSEDRSPEVTVSIIDNNPVGDGDLVQIDADLDRDGVFSGVELGYANGVSVDGKCTIEVSPDLPLGTIQIRARASDSVGNQSQSIPLTIRIIDSLLQGDYSRDGNVGAADYVVWRKTFGNTGVPAYSGADGSGNGSIGLEDYGVWRTHFGNTPAAGSGANVKGGTGSGADVGLAARNEELAAGGDAAGQRALLESVAVDEISQSVDVFRTAGQVRRGESATSSGTLNARLRFGHESVSEVLHRDDALVLWMRSGDECRVKSGGEAVAEKRWSDGDSSNEAVAAIDLALGGDVGEEF